MADWKVGWRAGRSVSPRAVGWADCSGSSLVERSADRSVELTDPRKAATKAAKTVLCWVVKKVDCLVGLWVGVKVAQMDGKVVEVMAAHLAVKMAGTKERRRAATKAAVMADLKDVSMVAHSVAQMASRTAGWRADLKASHSDALKVVL